MIKKGGIISLITMCALSLSTWATPANFLKDPNTFEINNEYKVPNLKFSLANLVDGILNSETVEVQKQNTVEDSQTRQAFVAITKKFNQGNASAAYSEYDEFIDKVNSDISRLNLAKVFYEIGFFSLGDKIIEKISDREKYSNNIQDLKKCYKPKVKLTKEEEIYFAKLYSSIFFDNSAQETILELVAKKDFYPKNDYYNYMLSRAYFFSKQYSKANSAINRAISINSDTLSYELLKIDILTSQKQNSKAAKIISKLEKNKSILEFQDDIELKKQELAVNSSKNERERKYAAAYKTFLEGNFEKTKKDCLSILNFDKDNDKIISLIAKAELATGNIEKANILFCDSYRIEKNNLDTLIGLADIRYIHKDYKGAIKYYKKALRFDKNNFEILLKLSCALREDAQKPKVLKKVENLVQKYEQNNFVSYYESAISIAQKNTVLKQEFLNRSFAINPLYRNTLGELVALEINNKNYKVARSLIDNASYTLEKNYYYYYLLGLYNQAQGKKREAIYSYKTSLNLNSNFEASNKRLIKLIPDKLNEEI